jgi:hypothetical protein
MAKRTTWIHDWNKLSFSQRVRAVHDHTGKYCVLVLGPVKSLENAVPNQATADWLLKDARGHILAKYGEEYALYRAFAEKDADISYSTAKRILDMGKREPKNSNQLFKVVFGKVSINERYADDKELRSFLAAKFGRDNMKIRGRYTTF